MAKGGRDKKSSKGRLDKYYHLAKEQGYRARSAFKLIQLNKKYNFLERSRVLIDLCAAPGGWLQVATKYMPQSSLIIGVDLAPIKPIPNVITFQDDITTDRCRQNLRQEIKTWKADVVLHDGAPNVGAAWTHDAFTQSELVLVSLKLATEFLMKGGTFVTKVFRSKDYNKLLWVFQQLFRKVEATKPPSSRGVSAEIFVVCRDFIAPKKLDPRFLDPKAVFSELDTKESNKMIDIFKPEKKKRQREGYEDGNYTLHKTADVMEFIKAEDPIAVLGSYNQLTFKTDESMAILKNPLTSEDVKVNCEDLKVLGKSDFKSLLKWRTALRTQYKLDKKEEESEQEEEEEELDDDEKLQAELENLSKEEAAKRKRLKRKNNEKKMKLITRMQLNMTVPSDIGLEQEGADGHTLFNIRKINKEKMLEQLQNGNMDLADQLAESGDHDDEDMSAYGFLKDKGYTREMDQDIRVGNTQVVDKDEYDSELEDQLDEDYERYIQDKAERNAKFRAKQAREEQDEWAGFDDKNNRNSNSRALKDESDLDSDDSEASSDDDQQDIDDDMSSDDDDDDRTLDSSSSVTSLNKSNNKISKQSTTMKKNGNSLINDLGKQASLARKTSDGLSMGASMFFDQDIFDGLDGDDEEEEDDDDDESNEPVDVLDSRKRKAEEELDEDSDFEMENTKETIPSDDEMWSGDEDENSKAVRKAQETGLMTAEAVTLARQLVNREKTKEDLVDEGFSREGFRDKEGLPAWFLDDEGKHNKPNLPITKEAVLAIREKLKALDARPIKKIAEAKARKKYKTMKRLQKAQKKATDVAENEDMSEKEKLTTINKILARSTKSKPKKEVKLVVAKGANRGIKGRPSGVKGRYKMVDGRMKKEMRAVKRQEKKKGGGRRK
ncbi:Spb1 C-terminal domain-containing protein [Halteromyces radiatus]|uniref:Spb1 C-terminal domain-containing protein n=1 Tax=Halteromyces radiatus TaxID=101107 RepID=UPI00221EE1E5|nr:Spb1 C-terminal domain-containing protein [Halteromyces radiatus]KAI8092480.1 Spb1 C-terminal domain-containing protein [Halteromyces radiatus]